MADFPENIQSQLQKAAEDKSPEQRTWDLCLLFLAGRQWLTYDKNLSRHITSKSSQGGATKVTVNLLLNIYRNLMAKLSLAYPGVVVLPASPSAEDISKAKASETALRYYWSATDMKGELFKAVEWLLSCGTVGLHTYYDPGKESVVTKTVSPYDLFFEPDAPSVEESQWVAIRSFEIKEVLAEAYPDYKEEILGGRLTQDEDSMGKQPDDRVDVFEIYWRDGRHAVCVGSHYLFQEDSYPIDAFPVEIIKYTDVPRRLWGLSMLAPLLDLQWLYNKARSQLIDNVELMSNPKWLVPKTAGVAKNAITNRPGEIISYNAAGGAPQMMQTVPIPGYVMDNIAKLQSEISDVSGVHSISLGKRAVGISSGKAIQALAQQDSSQLMVTQMGMEKAVGRLCKTVLLLMKTYYTEGKMARMLDGSGQVIFTEISATDLTEDPEIFIETGSLFRNETQDRDAKVLEMLERGLVSKDVALQELSFRTGNSFVTEKVQAIAHAKDILEACQRGYEVEIFRSDDTQAFIKVFGDFMRERAYYQLEEDRQEYIRDVYVSLVNADLPPDQYEAARLQNKVFPRTPPPGASETEQASMIVAQGSPQASQQIADEVVDQAADIGVVRNAPSMLRPEIDPEALIPKM